MDVQKHGGKIYLPGHLHENLSESLQQVLTSKCTRGATANEESASYGTRHQQKTSPNKDGESSIISRDFSVMEPETEGGVLDDSMIHEGQHPDAIAWGKSYTEFESAGKDAGRQEQGGLAPVVQAASVQANGALIEVQLPAGSLAGVAEEQAEPGKFLPGPGWTLEYFAETTGSSRLTKYWVSPSRTYGFRQRKQVFEFEILRVEYDNDEVKALAELKKMTTKKIRYKRLSKPGRKTK